MPSFSTVVLYKFKTFFGKMQIKAILPPHRTLHAREWLVAARYCAFIMFPLDDFHNCRSGIRWAT
jgi:hypothetical protein